MTPELLIRPANSRVRMPERKSPTSITMDVFAYLMTDYGRGTSRAIHQKATTEVPTGLTVFPPPGYHIRILPKDALSRKGIIVVNSVIDCPSELTIFLFNGSFETHYVAHEHRIAKLILSPAIRCTVVEDRVPPPEHPQDVHP